MGKDKTPENDMELFRQVVGDVKPLQADERISYQSPKPSPRPRRKHAGTESTSDFCERDYIVPVDSDELLLFTRPGIQHRQLQRLKRGDIPGEARLDLHGQTIDQAGASLHAFLNDSVAAGRRCVVVVHGKGQRSGEDKPILKSQVNHWLRDSSSVLAFCSAQPRDGGAGALYVLLRRS